MDTSKSAMTDRVLESVRTAAEPSAAHIQAATATLMRYSWHQAPLAKEDILDASEPFEAWATELPGHRVEGQTPWDAFAKAFESAVRIAAISLAEGRKLPVPVCDLGRIEQMNIKLTAREMASIRDESRRQGKNLSEWARERLTARGLRDEDRERILEIWEKPASPSQGLP